MSECQCSHGRMIEWILALVVVILVWRFIDDHQIEKKLSAIAEKVGVEPGREEAK